MSRRFVDEPALAAAFAAASFDTVPITTLRSPPSSLSLSALPPLERKEARYGIRYWQAEQAGDVLYNDWD